MEIIFAKTRLSLMSVSYDLIFALFVLPLYANHIRWRNE